MATYNFDAPAYYPDGGKIFVPGPQMESDKPPPVEHATIGKLIYISLNGLGEDEKTLGAADRYKRGKLACRILKGGDIDLDEPDKTLIHGIVGKSWMPQIVVLLWDALASPKAIESPKQA